MELLFAAIGIRAWIQNELGYQAPQSIERESHPKIEDLTLRQTRTLILIATLREAYDTKVEGDRWFDGIDPVFWNMPLLALENLNDRLTLTDDEFFQELHGQWLKARLGSSHPAAYRSELNSYVSGLRDSRASVNETKKRKAFEEFVAELHISNSLKPSSAKKIVDRMIGEILEDLEIEIDI